MTGSSIRPTHTPHDCGDQTRSTTKSLQERSCGSQVQSFTWFPPRSLPSNSFHIPRGFGSQSLAFSRGEYLREIQPDSCEKWVWALTPFASLLTYSKSQFSVVSCKPKRFAAECRCSC